MVCYLKLLVTLPSPVLASRPKEFHCSLRLDTSGPDKGEKKIIIMWFLEEAKASTPFMTQSPDPLLKKSSEGPNC